MRRWNWRKWVTPTVVNEKITKDGVFDDCISSLVDILNTTVKVKWVVLYQLFQLKGCLFLQTIKQTLQYWIRISLATLETILVLQLIDFKTHDPFYITFRLLVCLFMRKLLIMPLWLRITSLQRGGGGGRGHITIETVSVEVLCSLAWSGLKSGVRGWLVGIDPTIGNSLFEIPHQISKSSPSSVSHPPLHIAPKLSVYRRMRKSWPVTGAIAGLGMK